MGGAVCSGQKGEVPKGAKQIAPGFDWQKAAEANRPPTITDDTVIEYLTDVEGNWEYVVHFVSRSRILYWDGPSQGVWGPGELRIKDNGILVFGGDAPDKGPGDIRFVKLMLKLKAEKPEQVFFVLGNRDLMKLRFMAELADGKETSPFMPPWDPKAKPYPDFLKEQKLSPCAVSKCKWLLHCTMGCQDTTFRTRQDELAMLNGSRNATDEHVVQSYLDSIDPSSPDPFMLQFLIEGVIGIVLGDTLFVHGGLQDESIGFVPGREDTLDSVHKWVDALNAWKDSQLEDFVANPHWTGSGQTRKRAASSLIEYGTPGAGKKTVIYYNPFVDGNPAQRSEKVQDFLQESNINRVLTGHQPHGQMPTVVRHPNTGLLVITADTSRSDANAIKVFNPANNRGNVVAVVWIQGDFTYMEGINVSGSELRFKVHVDPKKDDDIANALVGRQLVDGSWVKAVELNKDTKKTRVITALGRGFNVIVRNMDPMKACLSLKSEYGHCDPYFRIMIADIRASLLKETLHLQEQAPDPDDALEYEADAVKKKSNTLDKEAFDNFETYIFAFNGVVKNVDESQSAKIVTNINRLLEQQKRVVFVTNDSTMSRADFYKRITSQFGIMMDSSESSKRLMSEGMRQQKSQEQIQESVQHDSIITSAYTAAWYLKQVGLKKPFVICSGKGLIEELELAGITEYYATVEKDGTRRKELFEEANEENIVNLCKQIGDIDSIVVGWDHQLSALSVAVAAQFITWREELRRSKKAKRMPLIACSMDESGILGRIPSDFPTESFRGLKVRNVGNGTMVRAITESARLPDSARIEDSTDYAIDVGKPSLLLQEHLRRPRSEGGLGIDERSAVIIGDGMDTDIKMANRSGMKSLLVLSGVASGEALAAETDPVKLPTWTVPSFADV